MVCCKLKEKTEHKATYEFGNNPKDMTGLLAINISDLSFEVLKEPESGKVYIKHIRSMLFKYKNDFANGIFKDKIAYQSH